MTADLEHYPERRFMKTPVHLSPHCRKPHPSLNEKSQSCACEPGQMLPSTVMVTDDINKLISLENQQRVSAQAWLRS
jgi:hypothetical protein